MDPPDQPPTTCAIRSLICLPPVTSWYAVLMPPKRHPGATTGLIDRTREATTNGQLHELVRVTLP
jgi:hypothetical protein